MNEQRSDLKVICISLRAVFDKLREGGKWGDGLAEAQVSAFWLEDGLLRRYGHDSENADIVRNTFRAVKEDFDQAWDLNRSSMEAAL